MSFMIPHGGCPVSLASSLPPTPPCPGGTAAHASRLVERFLLNIHGSWLQASGQELIDALKPAFVRAIKEFYKANHAWPEKILVFRDGVGDSQLSIVAR